MPQESYRLAVFAPHPVQYHVGIYRALEQLPGIESTVFYEDRIGLEPVFVEGFGQTIKWDIDLLGGYRHVFLRNLSRNPEGGFFSRTNPGVVKVLRRGAFDAVLFAGYIKLTDWLVYLTARLTGTPMIFRGEAILRPGVRSDGLKARVKRWCLPRFLKRVDAVLCSCSGNREYFRHYGVPDEKMRLIPCAVDNDFFQAERERLSAKIPALREKLGLRLDDFVIAFAARMLPIKRGHDLIEAVSRVGRSDVVILFIGDGPERARLERLAEERGVRTAFVGFINQGEISNYYVTSNMFAMVSEFDRSPKALNEALNFALPIVCTRVVGTGPDLVHEGENGFVVDVGDVTAMAEKIDYLSRNRDTAEQMGKRSLCIVADWSFEADAEAVRQAVVMACEGKRRPRADRHRGRRSC